MGSFTLTFNTDNAAFRDDAEHLDLYAVADTIRDVADLVGPGNEWVTGNVRDINGNTIGTFRLDES